MKPALILLALTSIAFAQGNLTPPGAPGLTMKSLDQIEPCIPLTQTYTPGNASCVFRITQPGSYYLPGNIKPPAGRHGILIALLVPGVVELDLRGFTLDGTDAGAAASAVLCNNENLSKLRLHNGTISNFAGTACLQTAPNTGTFVYQKIEVTFLMNGAGVSTPGRLLMSDCSISGTAGIPIQAGRDSVLSGVEISGSGATTGPILSMGDRAVLENTSLSWSWGVTQTSAAMMLGPDSTIDGMSLRLSNAIFTGPVLANSSGFTGASGVNVDLSNVTAPCVHNSYSFGATQTGSIVSPRDSASGQATGRSQFSGVTTANSCTFSTAVVILPLLHKALVDNEAFKLTGTTTTPSVVRVEADNISTSYDVHILPTATVSGPVIDIAASGTTTSANIRGGNVGVRLSSGTGNTVEGCSLIGLFVPGVGIQISAGVTNSLVRNNRASRLPAGGGMVQNSGGATNFIAPVLNTPAMLSANTNPFANIVH